MKALHTLINGETAGGQMVCLRIIEALRERGDEAVVVSPTEGPFTALLRGRGVSVRRLPFEKTYSFHRAFQLSGIARAEKVALIHTHGMVPHNIHSRLAARLAGIPCISHMHIANVFNRHAAVRAYQQALDNWTSGFCHKLIAVSRSTAESLKKQGIPDSKIEVVPNGMDAANAKAALSREEVLRRFGIPERSIVIGTVGRLCPVKGQEEFLLAAAKLVDKFPDLACLVVGKDMEFGESYAEKLRRLAERLGLARRVVFTGHQEDTLSLMNAMDVFVLASKAEGLPLVILEAMAMKKAVVASDVGGVGEAVDQGRTGSLVPAGDVEKLVESVERLLGDETSRKAMGEAGYRRVLSGFSQSRALKRVLEIYAEALSQ